MAIEEDPYFVTADPYGDLMEGEEVEDFGEVEVQHGPADVENVEEDFYYAEGEEEEAPEAEALQAFEEEGTGYSAEDGAFVEEAVDEVVESAEVEEDGEEGAEEYAEEGQEEAEEYELQHQYQTEQEPRSAEETDQDQGTEGPQELPEELPEEEALLDLPDDLPGEVEPCSPGLGEFPSDELEETEEGLGFHTGLDEVDYTPQDSAEGEEVQESDEEPQWLRHVGVLDPKVAEEADVSAAFLGLTGSEMDLDMAFPQYIPCLARYLVGHPEALVTKKKKGHKKGSGKRYFGGEDRSEDVMADKVVVGCWACGKLDHESQECIFKRCFVCSEQGHEVSECRSRKLSCKRCFRQGHVSDQCPMHQYDASFDDEGDMSFCRCMKCGEEGHLNCGSLPQLEFREASDPQQGWYENGRAHQDRPPGSWSPQGDRWERQGGWDGGWQQNNAMHWMFQAGLSPLPVGQVDWVPPAGDGGGYGDNGSYGGGNRWMRSGNNKGWGGGNRWNNGGWGRQGSWDHGGGWAGWDGGPHKRRRR